MIIDSHSYLYIAFGTLYTRSLSLPRRRHKSGFLQYAGGINKQRIQKSLDKNS